MKVAEFIAELGFDLTGEEDLRRFESGMKRAERNLQGFVAKVAKFGAVAGAAIGAGMAALGKGVIETSAQFEGFEVALTTIEGSAEKARQSMDWVSKFARETPYDIAGITDAFIRLKTMGIDPIADDTLRTLGDAASAMNKPLLQAVEALTDATTFQFERLREFGITTQTKGNEVTFSWVKNGEVLTKVVKKNGAEIRKFLLENLGDRFNGAMLRQSKTWNGMMSNLGDAWEDFKLRIGRGGFFDTVKNRLADLLDWIGELDADGTLDRWSKRLSDIFTSVADTVGAVAQRLARHGKTIADWAANVDPERVEALKYALIALAAWAMPAATAIAAVALAVDDLLTYLRGGDSVLGRFVEAWDNALLNMEGRWQQFAASVRGTFRDFSRNLATDLRLPDWLRDYLGIAEGQSIDRRSEIQNRGQGGIESIQESFQERAQTPGYRAREQNKPAPGEESPIDRFLRGMGRGGSDKSSRVGPNPERFGQAAPAVNGLDELRAAMANMDGHLAAMSADAVGKAVTATITDARQDNRQFPVSTSVTVNQTVQQASDAPRAAATATGNAVGEAAARQASRFEMDPSF